MNNDYFHIDDIDYERSYDFIIGGLKMEKYSNPVIEHVISSDLYFVAYRASDRLFTCYMSSGEYGTRKHGICNDDLMQIYCNWCNRAGVDPYEVSHNVYDYVYVVMSVLNEYKNIERIFRTRDDANDWANAKNFGNDLRDKQYYILEVVVD